MIFTTQGHEKGIGLEVFIKAFICLSKKNQAQHQIIVNKDCLIGYLETLNLPFTLKNNQLFIAGSTLNCVFINHNKSKSFSLVALEKALELAKKSDIINTLPTSKDQFNSDIVGHTDYLRRRFDSKSIGMNFLGPKTNVLLLTDHIALDEVFTNLELSTEVEKVITAIKTYPQTRPIKEIFLAGINPHSGENGLISDQDTIMSDISAEIKKNLRDITVNEVQPGDTLHFKANETRNQLFVYPSHDQGLGVFKSQNGLIGINYSTGLPFKRVSVDHGTGFGIYGKNIADYTGMLYLLNEVANW